MSPFLVTDLALARRLERCEGATNASFVEARKRLEPDSGAAWRDFDGTYAMFDGLESPITQTFGVGLYEPPSEDSLGAIEEFFAQHGAPVFHETCPLADSALLSLLPGRGYRPLEQSSVLYRELSDDGYVPTHGSGLQVRRIDPGEEDLWAETSMRGWGESPEVAAFMRAFGLMCATSDGTHCFLAEHDGTPVAAAALAMHEGVGLLAGASTIPASRGRGAQSALLAARLHHALQAGCDVAMMAAQPGSGSQRNAERQGFRIGYTRTKWGLGVGF
jgi:GNAT superfamily N-acetyltransferase